MASYLRSPVDLEEVAESYQRWQTEFRRMVERNDELQSTVSMLTKQHQVAQEALQSANEEKTELQNLVKKWQSFVSKLCDLEDENNKLKQQLEDQNTSSQLISEAHARQQEELLCELGEIRATHSNEIEHMQQMAQQQARRDKALLEKQIEEKSGEVRQLQKKVTTLEREKHNELVKLRLEYDSKLLRLQKQLAKGQATASSNVGHDIFRKKLDNCKAESAKEVGHLKKRITDLEQQLAVAKAQARRHH